MGSRMGEIHSQAVYRKQVIHFIPSDTHDSKTLAATKNNIKIIMKLIIYLNFT